MCGLHGYSVKKQSDRVVPLMTALSIFMDRRGGHSWGYYANDRNIQKGLGNMSEDVSGLEFKDSTLVLAHCRWATHGPKIEKNAHPFIQGNIIGAHNGVIVNHEELNKVYDRAFEVDSQHIFQHINDGLDLAELRGYGAITYINTENPDDVELCRFNGGVLSMAVVREPGTEEDFGTVWASTDEALRVGLAQSGWDWRMVDVKMEQFYAIRDSIPYELTGEKMPVAYAPKWTPPVNPVTASAEWDANDYGPYGHNGPYGSTVRRFPSTDNGGASSDLKIVEAIFSRVGDVTAGKDLDILAREAWLASGKFYHKGRCFMCSDLTEVVKHGELDERLCLDCNIEWTTANEDSVESAEWLRNEFLKDVALRRSIDAGGREVIVTNDGFLYGAAKQTALPLPLGSLS